MNNKSIMNSFYSPTLNYKKFIIVFIILLYIALSINYTTEINTAVAKQIKKSTPSKKINKKAKKKKIKKKDKTADEEKNAKKIERILDYGINQERLKAINKILIIKNKGIKNRLLKKLIELIKHESDTEVLVKAITVLSELQEKDAIPVLIVKLDTRSEDVQISTVYALKNLNGISAKNKLIQKLKKQDLDTDSNLTEALINTLGGFKAVELLAFAKNAVENNKTSRMNRELLVLFIGRLNSPESKNFLIKLFKDEEENITIRSYAVNSLAKLGVSAAVSEIKKTVTEIESYPFKKKKKYYTLYMYSIAALIKLGDKEVYPKLINSLRSNNSAVRLKAVNLLKELKDKRTIDILKYKMKYDPNIKVKEAAEEALKELNVITEKK